MIPIMNEFANSNDKLRTLFSHAVDRLWMSTLAGGPFSITEEESECFSKAAEQQDFSTPRELALSYALPTSLFVMSCLSDETECLEPDRLATLCDQMLYEVGFVSVPEHDRPWVQTSTDYEKYSSLPIQNVLRTVVIQAVHRPLSDWGELRSAAKIASETIVAKELINLLNRF